MTKVSKLQWCVLAAGCLKPSTVWASICYSQCDPSGFSRWELPLQDDHILTPCTFCTYWLEKSPFFCSKANFSNQQQRPSYSTSFREIKEFFQPKALSECRWIVVDMSTEGITEGDNSHVFPVFWLADFIRAQALVSEMVRLRFDKWGVSNPWMMDEIPTVFLLFMGRWDFIL